MSSLGLRIQMPWIYQMGSMDSGRQPSYSATTVNVASLETNELALDSFISPMLTVTSLPTNSVSALAMHCSTALTE